MISPTPPISPTPLTTLPTILPTTAPGIPPTIPPDAPPATPPTVPPAAPPTIPPTVPPEVPPAGPPPPPVASHKLEADGIQLQFGERKILQDIYLLCETGRITGLLGRNGQGKTCLMNIIYGSLPVETKSIRIDHQSYPKAFKRPDLLVYLPQFHFIPGSLTLKRLFPDFGLDFGDFEKRFPEFSRLYRSRIRQLSGGQRRLTEVYLIARSPSRFAMLDEPFSHLMPLHVDTMIEILAEEKKHKGILITDHLYRPIVSCADRLYVLSNGKTRLAKKMDDLAELGYLPVD